MGEPILQKGYGGCNLFDQYIPFPRFSTYLEDIKTDGSLMVDIWVITWRDELYFGSGEWISVRKLYLKFVVKTFISLKIER